MLLRKIMKVKLQFDKKCLYKENKHRRRYLPMTEVSNMLGFELKRRHDCFVMSPSVCHPCYRSRRYRLYRVTTHENYISLDFCEVRSVNFLKKTLNYLIIVALGKYEPIN